MREGFTLTILKRGEVLSIIDILLYGISLQITQREIFDITTFVIDFIIARQLIVRCFKKIHLSSLKLNFLPMSYISISLTWEWSLIEKSYETYL